MDDERLQNPAVSGASPIPGCFDELLERIRDIVTVPVSYAGQGLKNFWNASGDSRQRRELTHEDAFVLDFASFIATWMVRRAEEIGYEKR